MKMSRLAFAGVLATGLFILPSLEARTFGYTALKAGYSYEKLAPGPFRLVAGVEEPLERKSSSAGVPLGVSAGFGYYFTPGFGLRLEAEYIYRLGARFADDAFRSSNNASPSKSAQPRAQIQSVLGNIYLDYYVVPSVNFYLSTGVGSGMIDARIAWVNFTTPSDRGELASLKKSSLTWQVGMGMGIALGQNLGLDFNVRYIDFGKAQIRARGAFAISGDLAFNALEALVGLSYRF